MIELTVCLVFVSAFCLSFILFGFLRDNKRNPKAPGPWGFPIIGHLPLFGNDPPATFKKWRQKYGDVFRIRMGSWNTVVINGYSAIEEALERQGDIFSNRPDFITTRTMMERNDGLQNFGFGFFNPFHIQLRKHTARAFRVFTKLNVQFTQTLIQEVADEMIDEFLSWNGEANYVENNIQASVGSIMYQIVYGKGDNTRENENFKIIMKAEEEFRKFAKAGNPLDVMPWIRFIMPWKLKTHQEIQNKTAAVNRKIIHEHIAMETRQNDNNLTDIFLDADLPETVPDNRLAMSKKGLLCALNDLIMAGFETTEATMRWLLLFMIAYPDVQRRVQKEIDEVVGCSRKVDTTDRPKLRYTEATIYEVLRLADMVPFVLPHSVMGDTVLNGYQIGKDTVAMMNFNSMHFEKSFWGDPEVFRPSRLIDANNELDKEKLKHIAPFGLGRRRCIGEHLAKMEVFLLFSTLMQRCCFRKPKGDVLDFEPLRELLYRPKSFKAIVIERQ